MSMKVLIMNGPNLNLVGQREPGIYGEEAFEPYFERLKKEYPEVELDYFQSNVEGVLIDRLQQDGFLVDGIILNAGGYTHTSVAIRDAVKAIKAPVVEVHISNITAREEFRHTSMITPVCIGMICGFGLDGYRLALEALKERVGK